MIPKKRRGRARRNPVQIAKLLALILVLIGVYAAWAYYRTERKAQELEKQPIVLHTDSASVSEVGYIIESRTTRSLWKQEKKIIWWVKVPTTNEVWACDWQGGFAGFADNDSVRLVHIPGGPDGGDWSGYIIGMHNSKKDKIAQVWALDVADIEMLIDR